jgi:hypothetical protein
MRTKTALATTSDAGYKAVVIENFCSARRPKINFMLERAEVGTLSVSGYKHAFLKVGINATASIMVMMIIDQIGSPVTYHGGIARRAPIKDIQSLFAIRIRDDDPSPISAKAKLAKAVSPVTHAPAPPPHTT